MSAATNDKSDKGKIGGRGKRRDTPKLYKNTDKTKSPHEELYLELVPKIVDNNPHFLTDPNQSSKFCIEEVAKFQRILPEQYKHTYLKPHTMGIGAEMYHNGYEEYGLLIGYKTGEGLKELSMPNSSSRLTVMRNGINIVVNAPIFDLSFEIKDDDLARRVLQAALSQFFIFQKGQDAKDMAVCYVRNETVEMRGLDALTAYLPSTTQIEARCFYKNKVIRAPYTL